jgi:hypothetical protein
VTNVWQWRDIGNVNMGMEDWIWERTGRVHEGNFRTERRDK